MIKVWALQFSWRIDLQEQVLRKTEELLDSEIGASLPANDRQILHGQIITARSQQLYFSNQTSQAIDLCRQALTVLPSSWIFVRGGAMMYLGMSMQASGQVLEAERLLLAEYESYGYKTDSYALFLLLSLGFIYLNSGQLDQARRIAQVLLQAATRSRIAIMKNWGDWFLGVVCYQRNELEVAAQQFMQIIENRYTAQIAAYRDAVAGLALIHQIQGESDEAWQMVESISQFDIEQRGSEDNRTRSLRARLMLLQGDLEGAGRWADTFTDLPQDQSLMWLEEPQVTRAHILVARGMNADLRLATRILDILDDITDRTHNTRFKVEILALRALALDAQGKTSKANALLKQTADIVRSEGFIRVVIDLGKPMKKMLHRLAKEDHSAEIILRILAAFPDDSKYPAASESPAPTSRHPSLGISTLAEPLTPREFEVLSLLRGPLSMKEIALELNLSYTTVKSHTNNIYGKLGVNRRWKAVARAEELNILPPR
jgi:LuxR family transcriptional regulator, maltose regulon positive regulatory protein